MRKRDKAIVAGTAAAFAVAGAGAGIAATEGLSGEGSQAVIDDAAQQLGVESSELSAALKQALENRIDEAVTEGRLAEEQGEALKARIESADVPLVFGGFGRGFDHGFGFGHFDHFGKLETAASYLGLSNEALRERLQDGQSLADIAEAEGKSVSELVNREPGSRESFRDRRFGPGSVPGFRDRGHEGRGQHG